MSNVGIDSRLRRQVPVTPAKPPKLRLGLRTLVPHRQPSKRQQKDADSWPIACRNASLESLTAVGGGEASHQENRPIQSVGEHNQVFNNGNRPLIHHQRYNLKNRFQLLKTLGEGAYGKVKLATDKSTGEHVAIKYIKKTKIKNEHDLNRIRREIQILSSLRHKHIVNIREVFERKDKIVLVLDYAQGGELYDYLNRMGKLSELEARRIFRQIVSAIYYCHQNGIVHRDLKLENIILDEQGNVKIADFGLSNYYSHNSMLKTFCGSPLYASPEIVNGKPYHGPEVDVWSLGVILYTLVYGSMPFESNDLVSLKQQISQGDYSQPSKLSDAAGLIRHMLTVTPSRRATMEDALRHWWINFGQTHMPNDMTYSPDDEPPTLQYSNVVTGKGPLMYLVEPPAIIHHRNQSSISSDSDLELDLRPNRWTRRNISLDSTGNSVSSSLTGSPAPTPDSCRHFGRDNRDDAAIASSLLNLPSDVLEILKGCSSKSLAALLSKDSTCSELPNNKTACQAGLEEHAAGSQRILSVFDSERKPTRGILKRKGKFSGSEGQCGMSEEMATGAVDKTIPKCGHLPRRLPSFKDETHDIFVSRHRASQLLDQVSDTAYHESCTSAIPHSAWSSPPSQLLQEQHHATSPENIISMQDPHGWPVIASIISTPDIPSDSVETSPSQQQVMAAQIQQESILDNSINLPSRESNLDNSINLPSRDSNLDNSINLPSRESNLDNSINLPSRDSNLDNSINLPSRESTLDNKETTRVVYRPKGILKKSSLDDGRNRLSISSIGSNSSADILDLSYDSGDSDHFVNFVSEPCQENSVNTGHCPENSVNTDLCPENSVNTGHCPENSVNTGHCPENSVNTDLCPENSVNTGHCPENSVNTGHCPENSVNTERCPENSVNTERCPENSVNTGHCPENNVNTEDCPENSVNTERCPENSVNTGHCPENSVNTGHCPENSVNTGHCPENSVNTDLCPENSVNTGHCPENSVNTGHCPENSVNTGHCPENSVNTERCPENSVNTERCPENSVNTGHCPENSVNTERCPENSVNTGHCPENSVNTEHCPENSLNTGHCPENSLNTGHCLENSLNTERCPENSVNTGYCPENSVITGHCPENNVNTERCPENSVNTGHCPENSVNTGHCPENSVNTGHCPENNVHTERCPENSVNTGHCPENSVTIGHCPENNVNTERCPENSVNTGHCPENNMNTGHCPENSVNTGHCPENSLRDDTELMDKSEQACFSFDERLLSLEISDRSLLSFHGGHCLQSNKEEYI